MGSVTIGARSALGIGLTSLLLTAAGCDMFRPARPEPPASSDTIIPKYSFPDTTLETLGRGIQAKGLPGGVDAYIGGLADPTKDGQGFQAGFDPATVNRYTAGGGSVPTVWDLTLERNFYAKFATLPLAANSVYQMEWIRDDPSGNDEYDDVAGTALLHRRYVVYAIFTDGTALDIADGFVDLDFIRTSPERWVILRWKDRENGAGDLNPEALSFGQRRLELR